MSACWAAARLGVLVVAPDSRPTPAGKSTQPLLIMKTVRLAPSSTIAAANRFRVRPRARSEPKKPGPICKPKV